MEITLTAVFRKFPEGYAAFVEELPGANTQGKTLDEARENLQEAVAMVLQANRELAEESLRGTEVVREPVALTTTRSAVIYCAISKKRMRISSRRWQSHNLCQSARAEVNRQSAASRDHRLPREKNLQRFGHSRAV